MTNNDSPIKSYNQNIDKPIKATPLPREKQYKSTLELVVPFVSKPTEWYQSKENWDLCIWCKKEERVKTKFGLVVWCQKCYSLHALKHDGTFITPEYRVALAQDFDDLVQGKVKPPEITKTDINKVIEVDE